MRTALLCLLLTALIGCGSSPPAVRECSRADLDHVLSAIIIWDWAGTTSSGAMDRLSDGLHKYELLMTANAAECGGLTMLRRNDFVVGGICTCCIELQFARHREGADCSESLDAVTFSILVPTVVDAHKIVSENYARFNVPAAARDQPRSSELLTNGVRYQWPSGTGVEHIEAVASQQDGGGWVVRMAYGRTYPG